MSKQKFTIDDFEKYISKASYHNVILVRCGSFVGIYRYDKENKCLRLWRKINNESYVQRSTIRVENEGDYWGRGGSTGVSSVLSVNEAHLIPKECDLDNKEDLETLDRCLGGSHPTVKNRIRDKFGVKEYYFS